MALQNELDGYFPARLKNQVVDVIRAVGFYVGEDAAQQFFDALKRFMELTEREGYNGEQTGVAGIVPFAYRRSIPQPVYAELDMMFSILSKCGIAAEILRVAFQTKLLLEVEKTIWRAGESRRRREKRYGVHDGAQESG